MDLMLFMEQMAASDIYIIAAFFIGLMTAVSPCPMATNITAVAYLSRKIENSRHTLLVGFIYSLGRAFTYAGLASLIVYIGIGIPSISLFLQKYGEKILGPLLILIGLVMIEAVKFTSVGSGRGINKLKENLAERKYLGSFLLGGVFALAFCPFSAVLFFGMLIPLAIKAGDGIALPTVFAIATALPVIITSLLLTKCISRFGRMMNRIQAVERFVRKSAGMLFILIGGYYIFLVWL